jgi:alpha-D-ribose 1-methylphosphonate 5-triphosphate synthase subunit PhnH
MNNIQDVVQVQPGLTSPVYDSQGIFRLLLKGMAEPGLIARLDDVPDFQVGLNAASYAVALALFDQDTRINLTASLQQAEIKESLRFHTAAALVEDCDTADFVICNESDRPDLDQLNAGTETYPDQSCTLIIQCESFFKGIIYRASGPGIETSRKIRCSGFNGTLLHQRESLAAQFPLGIDLILTCDREFFCIPRTTKLLIENN